MYKGTNLCLLAILAFVVMFICYPAVSQAQPANDLCFALLNQQLDIKPGSCPNSFNRTNRGVLPVVLVGTDNFDPNDVDLASLELERADGVGGGVFPNEGPPGPHSVFDDVATPFAGELCDCHDLEGDGIVDLSMKFRSQDLVEVLVLDDLPAGSLVELRLTGTLNDGTTFEASDCVRIVPPEDNDG